MPLFPRNNFIMRLYQLTRMWADAPVMAAQPNIGGALCESSVFPFLVPRHKVWLTAAARVPCSNAANGRKVNFAAGKIPSGGKSPQKCIYSVPVQEKTSCKVLLTSVERRQCSDEAKMRNRLKLAGVPQTRQRISAISGPKFTIVWRHVEEIGGDIAV